MSKYHKAIVGCSVAIATLSSVCLIQSESIAQTDGGTTNNSNATGVNTGTTNGGGPQPVTPSGFTPAQTARASVLTSNISALSTALTNAQAATQAASTTTTPTPEVQGPQRFSRVADAADCACPNADTNVSATPPGPSPELQAAQAAEAEAAAKLAAAKAEAREFIETVNKENASGANTSIQIW